MYMKTYRERGLQAWKPLGFNLPCVYIIVVLMLLRQILFAVCCKSTDTRQGMAGHRHHQEKEGWEVNWHSCCPVPSNW